MAEPTVKRFVERGRPLGFVAELKDRGLWPPKLRDTSNDNGGVTATPFLVIPTTNAPQDNGERPQPNSKAFHSMAIWIEDPGGTTTVGPVVGVSYQIKCRIRNLGAFPAYGGMADFFVNTPAAFTAAAGTTAALPAIGHTGFSLLQGQETVIACPALWTPATPADLASGIVVHAYDPFADNLISRFNARDDRHVGRHDFTPDLYVRDWTDSPAIHDDGVEPSIRNQFYVTSDVWNRTTAAPGAFLNDQPQNEIPQQGNGAAGDNFVFARISRNDASIEQTVGAHFMFSEFGTGSPYVDCSSAADPSVTLLVGESTKVVSLPWHLHPTSSNHLCIAVQIYSMEDPFMPPGLLGYTPGWPTTDMMVINDNNKGQRNILWESVPAGEGARHGIVFNAATFKRDVRLALDASKGALRKLRNARLRILPSGSDQAFKPGSLLVLKDMMPGERRWVAFSWDGLDFAGEKDVLSVFFGEQLEDRVVNGFGFELRSSKLELVLPSVLTFQSAVFNRLSAGMGVDGAKEGIALCASLLEGQADLKAYFKALPVLTRIMSSGVRSMSANFGGVKDVFGMDASLSKLASMTGEQAANALSLHGKILHQTDALLTMATKSRGDVADCPFTVRLQKEIYSAGALASPAFDELRKKTSEFIHSFATSKAIADDYTRLVQSLVKDFEGTVATVGGGPVKARLTELIQNLAHTPEEIQKSHLNFLNALLLTPLNR
jgi:hypothetical protein